MNRLSTLLLVIVLGLSACSSMPDHAKYIPKDALVVVGLNTKEIGKKMAWNAIMGSKLLEDMQKEKTGSAISDPAEIGIEMMSTSYVYIKEDKRFKNGNRVTALVPLEDAAKWEAFVAKNFPEAAIKPQEKYKEALLAEGMYAGWTKDLLVLMNSIELPDVKLSLDSTLPDSFAIKQVATDVTQLAAEMATAFTITKENSLTGNNRFTKMENADHDITLWINYDRMMGEFAGAGNMMGLSLSNTLWKDAALSAGFDFETGKIGGDILYYVPEGLKPVAKELGKTDADKEMIERLPGENLDMLMAWHLAPEGVKGLLDKTGILGFLNLALSGQNLSVDEILGAFSGDMAVSLNNFKLTVDTTKHSGADTTTQNKVVVVTDSTNTPDTTASKYQYSGDMQFTYALKIGKKESFNKLLQLAVKSGSVKATGNNSYSLKTDGSTATLLIDDKYCVIANHPANATGFLQGSFKGQSKAGATEIAGNPFGIFFNAQGMMNSLSDDLVPSTADKRALAESKKLLKDVHFTGGSFSSSAFSYKMSINFINQSENSLLQIMDFAMRMNKARSEALTAQK
ncbi:DUF4836 family protein [Polluticoccus soli]|uniref:DUF4836 family protein n=1 Tax=Polluticoccus soli TaxID=3034150 RepID=UPI0023E2F14D|nr:DUF4836 family protein [Flavipsychrobacter sp. JY13-12]